MTVHRTILLSLLIVGLGSAELAAVPRFQVADLLFTGPNLSAAQNPVGNVTFWLDIRHESGAPTLRVHGFWDADGANGSSGNRWLIRFAPTKAGRWTIINTYSNRSELNGRRENDYITAFSTAVGHGHWFPDADSAGRRWWKRTDGSHQYVIGNTFYDFLFRPNGNEASATTIRSDIESCASYFTKVRFCVMSPRSENTSTTSHPFLTTTGVPSLLVTGVPNPAFFRQRLDVAVKRAFELDLVCDLILGGTDVTGGRVQTTGEPNLHKYIAARYGAYANVWFTVGQEWDEVDSASGQIAKGNLLKSWLPYTNPISTHGLGAWKSALNSSIWSHSIRQGKFNNLASAADALRTDFGANGGKPTINDENGYDPGEANSIDVVEGILGSFAGGGYGTTGNKTGNKTGGYLWGHAAQGRTIADHPSIDSLLYLRQRIEARSEFWRLTPVGAPSASIFIGGSSSHRAMQEPGQQYILASDSAATYIAALPSGTWTVHRINVIACSESLLASATSGNFTFTTANSRAGLVVFRQIGTPMNSAPVVNAGADRSISWPANLISLSGSASDDGNPTGTLTYSWTKVSGPGSITFSAPSALNTNATVSAPGDYVVRLSANDGTLANSDEAAIFVTGNLNTVPIIRTESTDLGTAIVGEPYTDDLEADSGEAPLTWSLASGTLPPGILVAGSQLSGTPTIAGTFTFTVRVRDADGDEDTQVLNLTVSPSISGVNISNIWVASGATYQVGQALAVRDMLYVDRTYTFTGVGSLGGLPHLITANNDKGATAPAFLRFNVDRPVMVLLLYDQRATGLPLGFSGWDSVGEILSTGDTGRRVWTKNFPAGTITLPGNLAGGDTGARSMYSIAVTALPSGSG